MHRISASIVLLILVAAATDARAVPADSLLMTAPPGAVRHTRTFTLDSTQARVELETSFIVPGSDAVTLDGAPLVRGRHYRINTLKGSIILVEPAAGGERFDP